MRLFTSKSPHVVGREALFEDALDDFLHALPRQKPWMSTRYEALLSELSGHLNAELGSPAPLTAFTQLRVCSWLGVLSEEKRSLAARAVHELENYLVDWGWLETRPLQAA